MEIIVEGTGEKFFTPDKVIYNINFHSLGDTYESALYNGTEDVQIFIDKILLKNNFVKEDLKTRSFAVREEKKYDKEKDTYINCGFSYSQEAMLSFDYDKTLVSKLLSEISALANSPRCDITFSINNLKECKNLILELAYKDAENKAKAIAKAAGVSLKECKKIDFRPFSTSYMPDLDVSPFEGAKGAIYSASLPDKFANTFTPEDIKLSETLYCLWIAE